MFLASFKGEAEAESLPQVMSKLRILCSTQAHHTNFELIAEFPWSSIRRQILEYSMDNPTTAYPTVHKSIQSRDYFRVTNRAFAVCLDRPFALCSKNDFDSRSCLLHLATSRRKGIRLYAPMHHNVCKSHTFTFYLNSTKSFICPILLLTLPQT